MLGNEHDAQMKTLPCREYRCRIHSRILSRTGHSETRVNACSAGCVEDSRPLRQMQKGPVSGAFSLMRP